MKARKLTTLALTGALALGGLGLGSSFNAQPASAAQMNVLTLAETAIYSSAANVLNVGVAVGGNDSSMVDFETKHIPRFTIKNSVGTVVKTGSLQQIRLWDVGGPEFADPDYYGENTTSNISMTGLSKGAHYRVEVTIPMDNGTVTSATWSDLTGAFTYNADGTLTNFRP